MSTNAVTSTAAHRPKPRIVASSLTTCAFGVVIFVFGILVMLAGYWGMLNIRRQANAVIGTSGSIIMLVGAFFFLGSSCD